MFLIANIAYSTQMGWHTIAYEDSKCVILYNETGFTLVELYFGAPIKGAAVYGPINTFGLYPFHAESGGEMFRGYIEDWGMSKQKAVEKINDKCRPW